MVATWRTVTSLALVFASEMSGMSPSRMLASLTAVSLAFLITRELTSPEHRLMVLV
jgi:hypothetical protein